MDFVRNFTFLYSCPMQLYFCNLHPHQYLSDTIALLTATKYKFLRNNVALLSLSKMVPHRIYPYYTHTTCAITV